MWEEYYSPVTVDEALDLSNRFGENARLMAGGTDLLLELERGTASAEVVIDISRIAGLDAISPGKDGLIHIGPLVTHNQVVSSSLCLEQAYPLAMACLQVGSPQIRNRATVAGNLITASPANDTITPLLALDAAVTLRSQGKTRTLSLDRFYTGVRQTVLEPGEMLTDIAFKPLEANQRGIFLKLGLRKAQAIAVVNAAAVLTFEGRTVREARLALGAVAPTVIRVREAEAVLEGSALDEAAIDEAAQSAVQASRPIDDIRATADYRRHIVGVYIRRALQTLRDGRERESWPSVLPRLWGQTDGHFPASLEKKQCHTAQTPIEVTVNGERFAVRGAANKTLLRMLREDIGLTGTKEGCAEGECGACTVLMDGIAVDSCLVPAPRSHGSKIVTIEGLTQNGSLHPVQEAFIDEGAVQCGYCTPGFIMSAVVMIDENPSLDERAIREGTTGCLCRCTGYYKIFSAIERASCMR